jgi:hypothetical protein
MTAQFVFILAPPSHPRSHLPTQDLTRSCAAFPVAFFSS